MKKTLVPDNRLDYRLHHDHGKVGWHATWNGFSLNVFVRIMKLTVNRVLMATIIVSFSGLCETTYTPAVRDPFWPVDYVPVSERQKPVIAKPAAPAKPAPVKRTVEAPKPVVDWEAARKALQFSGFAEANGIRSFFVDGRLVSEGETFSRDYLGLRYTWRVIRIARDPAERRLEDLTVRPADDDRPRP